MNAAKGTGPSAEIRAWRRSARVGMTRVRAYRVDGRSAVTVCSQPFESVPMPETEPDIVVVDQKIEPAELARLVSLFFEDMVKYVVDIERGIGAVGGELHADAEQLLLESGSRQADLWGANYYPGKGRESCIEYTS